MTNISTQALYNPYFNLQTTSLGYTSLLQLYGTVPSQTANHHAFCKLTVNGRLVLILNNFPDSFYNKNQFNHSIITQ